MTAMHTHDVPRFDAWLETAVSTNIPAWRAFVDGLRRDLDAVHQGILLQWSQGPVEGSIHRLKLIKRAMYGRGRHDLLRLRVIFHLPD
jgi:transposase